MDYQKIYSSLINSAKDRGWSKKTAPCYVETHHIIPKSLGGTNDKNNLVCLTAREHFISHWLLWRIHRNKEMAFAFNMMCSSSPYKNSKAYEESCKARSNEVRRWNLSREYGEISEETREKMSKAQKGRLKGSKHFRFKGYWITPEGKWDSLDDCAAAIGLSSWTVRNRCKTMNHKWKHLGWDFEEVKK